MEVLQHKFVPGPCRQCGAPARLQGIRVSCSDPQCWHGKYWHPTITWPRQRVIDWRKTLPRAGCLFASGLLGALVCYVSLVFILAL